MKTFHLNHTRVFGIREKNINGIFFFFSSAPVSSTAGIYIHKLHFCFCAQTLQRNQSVCTVHDLPDRFKEHEFVWGGDKHTRKEAT